MSRSAQKVLLLLPLAAAGWAGLWLYEGRQTTAARETQTRADADQKIERLRGIASRLDVASRVARVIVTGQEPGPDGAPRTTLLWMEYTRDRRDLLPAKRFVLDGTLARVRGKVVRFQGDYAAENQPLAGRSVLLFESIAGGSQAAKDALPIDPPGGTPDVYKARDPRLAEAESPHWQEFWKLPADARAHAVEFKPGNLYTVTLAANVDLTIQSEPADAALIRSIEEGARRAGPTP